jgi:hypothetical protein
MKTILIAIALLLSPILYGQNYYNAYQVQAAYKVDNKWTWEDSKEADIEIKLEGSIVRIYNKSNTVINTYEDLGEENGTDKDGDSYKNHKWRAVDDKERKCLFVMTWYKNIPLTIYSVYYNDVAFRFYVKNNKLSNF